MQACKEQGRGQESRKRFRDPPHNNSEGEFPDLKVPDTWVKKVIGTLLPRGWTAESAKMPQSGLQQVMRAAYKREAALAAVYVLGSFFQLLPGKPGQEWFIEAGALPNKQAQHFPPPVRVSSQILVGERDKVGSFTVRWLMDVEVLAAFGYPELSASTSFLGLKTRRTMLAPISDDSFIVSNAT